MELDIQSWQGDEEVDPDSELYKLTHAASFAARANCDRILTQFLKLNSSNADQTSRSERNASSVTGVSETS